MGAYYLAAYVGTGTDDDPFRPSGAELRETWGSIDLRPPGSAVGRALLVVDEPLPPSPSRLYLGDDLDGLSSTVRRKIEGHLGVPLDGTTSLRRLIARLLIEHGDDKRKDRWNRLRPEGLRRKVYLGGLIYDMPVVQGGATISDNFTRADNTNISTGAPFTWTEVLNDCQISGNGIRNVTIGAAHIIVRAEVDFTADHFSAGTALAITTTTGQSGVAVRMASGSTECYVLRQTQNQATLSLVRISAATAVTSLASMVPTVVLTSGRLALLSAIGSSLKGTMGADALAATDTVIPSNLRCGFYLLGNGGTLRQMMFGWSAGDIRPATFTGSSTSAATATAKVIHAVTMAGSSTSAGSITAKPTVLATLAGPSTSAGTITAVPKVLATIAGSSTSSGSITATPIVRPVLSGASTSSGSATALVTHPITLSGASTSSGSATAVTTRSAVLAGPSTSSGHIDAVAISTVFAVLAGPSTSAGHVNAAPVIFAIAAGPSTSAGHIDATRTAFAILVGSSTSAGHGDFAAAATIVLAILNGHSVSSGHLIGPLPFYPPQVGVYVTDNRRTYASDNRADYVTDNRRTYT